MTDAAPPSAKVLLKVENLTKTYKETDALVDASLDVYRGQQVVLIGASGSGKSTMLRCISHLETPTSGTVTLDGLTIGGRYEGGKWIPDTQAELAAKRQHIGMVFQSFNLFAHLTAIENIAVGPIHVLGVSKDEAHAQAERLLDKVQMGKHADKYPSQLSGGEQQRVAIARALGMNPKLMLFDEPTSALDPRLTHEVLQVMQDLAEEEMTMMVVTHEIGLARRVADVVVFMEAGRIVEVNTAAIFEEPREDLTRQFLSYVL